MSKPFKVRELTDKVFEKMQRLKLSSQEMSRLSGVLEYQFRTDLPHYRNFLEDRLTDTENPDYCWGEMDSDYRELVRFVEESDPETTERLRRAAPVHPSHLPPEPTADQVIEEAISRGDGWVWAFLFGLGIVALLILLKSLDVETSSGGAALGGIVIGGLVLAGIYILAHHRKSKEVLRTKLQRGLDQGKGR